MVKKNMKKKGLGKGLEALIPETESSGNTKDKNFIKCSASLIEENPFQPRIKFGEKEIEELSESIKEYGIIQPVLVRKKPDSDKIFQIIAGERRVRAAKKAGLQEIPVIIKDIDDIQMLQISIVENIQRENLDPVEESRAYKRLIDEFGYTQENLAKAVGKSRPAITNSLRLLNLPENILDSLSDSLISTGHARALLASKDSFVQNKAFYEILDKKLSVRKTEHLISRLNENDINIKKTPVRPPEYNEMAIKLSDIIGAKVSISNKNNNSGKIEIKFKNRNELQKIFDYLNNNDTGKNLQ